MSQPAQNRVTPTGDILAGNVRGLFMGNRGCLHDGREIVRRWRSKAWITCAVDFRGRRVQQWAPGRYTVLFFHDEAVALAAGHRPCAECRRSDHRRFLDAWEAAHGERPRTPELDAVLHLARIDGSGQRTHRRPWTALPAGVFVDHGGAPSLVLEDRLVPWDAHSGYRRAVERPNGGDAILLTPSPTVDVIAAGYAPVLHEQALGDAR